MNLAKIFGLCIVFILALGLVNAAPACTLSGLANVDVNNFNTITFLNQMIPSTPATVNLTLDTGLVNITSIENIAANFMTPVSWQINSTLGGQKTITAVMENASGILCTTQFNYTVFNNASKPNVSASLEDLVILTVNQPWTFNVSLNNTGDGNATDVLGQVTSNAGFTVSPNTINLAEIQAESKDIVSYSLTPTSCIADTLNVDVNSYKDHNGIIIGTSSASDNYIVVGSDMITQNVSLSTNTTSTGSLITMTARVKNQGLYDANNVNVSFYYASTSNFIGRATVGIVAAGAESQAQLTWTVSSAGSYDIIAVVEAENDCITSNNQAEEPIQVSQSAVIPAVVTPISRGGGGGGGGLYQLPERFYESHYWSTMNPGEVITFNIDKINISFKQLQFKVNKILRNVQIKVEAKFTKPKSVLTDIRGENILNYHIVTATNIADEDIEDFTIKFKVEKKKLNMYRKPGVSLWMYEDNVWQRVSASKYDEDGVNAYYMARPRSLSAIFAITLKETAPPIVPSEEDEEPVVEPVEDLDVEEPAEEDDDESALDQITGAVVGAVTQPKVWVGIIIFLLINIIGMTIYLNVRKYVVTEE